MAGILFKVLIIIMIQLTFTTCIDPCKTGHDCYLQSLQLLNEDRVNLRNMHDEIHSFIEKATIDNQKEVEDDFAKMDIEWNAKTEQYTKNFSNFMNEVKKAEDTILPDVNDLKNKITTQKQLNFNRNYMYKEAIIYDNIITALEQGIVIKYGGPAGWDENSYRNNNLWNAKTMLKIGEGAVPNGNGMQTNIPGGYNVLWLRVSNHVWSNCKFSYLDGNKEELGFFTAGFRNLNEISPDGAASDSYSTVHIWFPVPVPRAGSILVQSAVNSVTWITGIAFGKNLWNHAKNSAVGYHWKVNGGTDLAWSSHNWNNDNLALISARVNNVLIVPVVNNGKDKILYIIEHNNNWLGTMHSTVKVNGVQVSRFRTSFQNPFAVNYNSKLYQRYIATIVPKELVNSNFLNVEINMANQDNHIHFREVGTHDLE